MDEELDYLYQEIIMDHVKNPCNYGLLHRPGYLRVHLNNPSCGDEVYIELLIKDEIILDVRQEGHGCSISMASASMMTNILRGKEIQKAFELIEKFYGLVRGENVDDVLEEARAMVGVSKFPMRVKCATLAWKACEKILKEE